MRLRAVFTGFVGFALVIPVTANVVYGDDNKQPPASEVSKAPSVSREQTSQTAKTQSPKSAKGSSQGTKQRARRPGDGVTAQQTAAVMALVRTHHPDLESLLKQLKASRPAQYTQAIRSLFRTSVRLASIQERDMEKYDLELRRWKLESQAQLLALKVARNQRKSSDAASKGPLHDELVMVAKQLRETRLALVKLEVIRQQTRLERLKEQMAALESNAEKRVNTDVQAMLRSAGTLVKASAQKRVKSKASNGRDGRDAKAMPVTTKRSAKRAAD